MARQWTNSSLPSATMREGGDDEEMDGVDELVSEWGIVLIRQAVSLARWLKGEG